MFRKVLTTLFVFMLVLGLPASAAAQSYSFRLDKEVVQVFWNSDGTMAIDYTFTFVNGGGAHVIDFVDVGTPNSSYDGSQLSADVNGSPVSISTDYQGQGSGFAVALGGSAIQPGQTGTVHVVIGRVRQVLQPDDKDQAYASATFVPTFFDGSLVSGKTDLTVTFHMPPGVKTTEPRWHNAPSGFPSQPLVGVDAQGRIIYTWNNANADGSSSYLFGASFPRSYVPADAIYTPPPAPPIDSGSLVGFLFFCCFGGIFFGIPVLTAIQGRNRKLQYLSPRISIEGHGIKRGLTAVEAAILMEQPLDKVMTMILFGVIKKDAADVAKRDPLELTFPAQQPADLHEYEKDFLEAFKAIEPAKRRTLLQNMTVALVKSVTEKMRGFSRKETVDYYKSIMERAWQQVEASDTPEVKSQKLDEAMEWTMLDHDYDGRMRRTFQGPIFVPMWWGRYDPTYRPGGFGGSMAKAGPSVAPTGRTSLPGADFAASVVGGVQTFSTKVIGDLNTFTSKVTGVTNPPPPPSVGSSSRGGGGGGGHSCACACACAGCACACAGGGR